jgi:hypothetical protein
MYSTKIMALEKEEDDPTDNRWAYSFIQRESIEFLDIFHGENVSP